MPRHLAHAVAAMALLALVAACGAPAPPPCLIPADDTIALPLLEGGWTVFTADGDVDGTMQFDGDRVIATLADVDFVGTWSHTGSDANEHRILLLVGGAVQGDVELLYPEPTRIALALVFSTHDTLYALQSDGLWTRWVRSELP